MKKTFYTEAAYMLGLVLLAFGTALMERADFGMSMVVAPAYILHLKLSQWFPAFSFGMAEYCLQLALIVLLSLVMGRCKRGYAFSFVTAVVYGFLLDGAMWTIRSLPTAFFVLRVLWFLMGMLLCAGGVAMLFHTYFAPEAYELVVKELADRTGKPIGLVKTVYDLTSLTLSVVLSFACFGWFRFEGVKLGTLFTALVNGWIIGEMSHWMDEHFDFRDGFSLRHFFAS